MKFHKNAFKLYVNAVKKIMKKYPKLYYYYRENEYEKAHTDFFEAFKNYDESGSPRRTTCLKYLVLANMLMKSGINPFDSQV